MKLSAKDKAKVILLSLVLTGFLTQVTLAGQPSQSNTSSLQERLRHIITIPKCPTVVFQFGGFDARQGSDQNINILNLIGDRFTVTHHNDQNVLIGLGYYVDGPAVSNLFKLTYGLDAFYLGETHVKGHVIQEHLFSNLGYNYAIQNIPVYAAAKALFKSNNPSYNFTADLGIGLNIIHAGDFHEYSRDGGITLPDRAFSGNTSASFSATVGVGVKYNDMSDRPIECGYRFFYLGEGKLHKLTNQITNDLRTGHSYANAVVCSISV